MILKRNKRQKEHLAFEKRSLNIRMGCVRTTRTSSATPLQAMLILILNDVQYSQIAVFSFEKGSNCRNHSSSRSHNLVKKYPQQFSLLSTESQGNS